MSNAILAEKYQKLIAEITETDEEISEINRYLKSAESKANTNRQPAHKFSAKCLVCFEANRDTINE